MVLFSKPIPYISIVTLSRVFLVGIYKKALASANTGPHVTYGFYHERHTLKWRPCRSSIGWCIYVLGHTHTLTHPPRSQFFVKPWDPTSFATTTQVIKTLGSTSIRHRSDTFVSDQSRAKSFWAPLCKMCLPIMNYNQLKRSKEIHQQ